MAPAHTQREAECSSPLRRWSGVLQLLAIASLLTACGGGAGPAPSASVGVGVGGVGAGGGGVSCATGATTTADLAWDAVADPNVAGYRVYYGTAPGTYPDFVDVAKNVTTVSVTGLSSGTTYYFAATTRDSSNESVFSNEVCKTIS